MTQKEWFGVFVRRLHPNIAQLRDLLRMKTTHFGYASEATL
jgi:hypothetical protein